ncbi:gata zinc finger domain-containing [Anaeramoeba flamelloides]|uniref:Gata zinc finger domain-containing n=1 Tax=Anaeramoeba flamelloides TaxID=1746091 RepID=A0AAV7YQ91_9EUKA|nr:gata zinc finger domain-containing [Anaeramoeba flamelloides]
MNSKICSNPNCRSTKTPSWRRVNGIIFCNACAIYAKRHNGEMRPAKKKKPTNTNKKNNKQKKSNQTNKKKLKNPNHHKKRKLTTIRTKTRRTEKTDYPEEMQDPYELQKLHYAGKRIPQNKKFLNTHGTQQQRRETQNEKNKIQNPQEFLKKESLMGNENEKEKEKEKENEKEKEKYQQPLYKTQNEDQYEELEKKLEQKIKKKKNQTKIVSRKHSPQNSSQELEEMSRSHKTTLRAGDCVGMRLQDGSEIYAIIQLFLKENHGEGNSFCKVIWLIPKIQSYKTDQQEFNPMELSPKDFIVGNAEPLAQPVKCITRKLNFQIDLKTLKPQKFDNK